MVNADREALQARVRRLEERVAMIGQDARTRMPEDTLAAVRELVAIVRAFLEAR
jgi:hypothetical protein